MKLSFTQQIPLRVLFTLMLVHTNLAVAPPISGPACLDESGSYVDSWVSFSTNEEYQYYWHDPVDGFVKSPYRTNQTLEGGIMRTVNQLYDNDLDMNNIAYALYNVSADKKPIYMYIYESFPFA
jgi:hypothetical protein